MNPTLPLAAAIALTLAPAAFAQTTIVPDRECGAVTFHVAGRNGEAVPADRLAKAIIFLPKQKKAMTPLAGARLLEFNASISDTNVVMAAADFKPEISGNETRTEHAKAFIRCGAIAHRDDWQRQTGIGLEIFPQWNGILTSFKQGDPMRFIAVYNQKDLLRDAPIEVTHDGSPIAGGVLDRSGGMNFPFQGPGHYTVTAKHRRADPQQPETWLVDTSTLTFDIK